MPRAKEETTTQTENNANATTIPWYRVAENIWLIVLCLIYAATVIGLFAIGHGDYVLQVAFSIFAFGIIACGITAICVIAGGDEVSNGISVVITFCLGAPVATGVIYLIAQGILTIARHV